MLLIIKYVVVKVDDASTIPELAGP